jgi:leucyl aminopeptidase
VVGQGVGKANRLEHGVPPRTSERKKAPIVLPNLVDAAEGEVVSLIPLSKATLEGWRAAATPSEAAWAEAHGFAAESGRTLALPGDGGRVAAILVGIDHPADVWAFAGLPTGLPAGSYALADSAEAATATAAAFGWALGGYHFGRYKGPDRASARLVWPKAADRAAVERAASATVLVRDLVNTPANDLGPAELATAAENLAREFGARFDVTVGDELLTRNYPLIHAVGRASPRAPRLIDITWGDPDAPKVTLVGKGVCFDSGGLDLKDAGGMLMMKKDMGGAAHALGVARMVMMAQLPVRLRVLIPAVENAVSGDAFRPMDIYRSRKGLTVEIGNTDAEGRLVLCDALDEASSERPELIVDFATLTGAARVALGTDLPAMFSNDDATADALTAASRRVDDPLWRMPLWQPYHRLLKSGIADINNAPDTRFGGAITAALFLERFVPADLPWVHIDLYAWNGADRPGRPKGGEAMTMRAVYALLEARFGGRH